MSGRKTADYDDNLLVDLIARCELTNKQIADRVGLSTNMVAKIARGETRAELRSPITAAMRKYLRRAVRAAGAPHQIPIGKRKHYDDELLVQLIGRGNLSSTKIAERVGLGAPFVRRVASGQARQDLQDRIKAAVRANRAGAQRMAVSYLRHMLGKHIRQGMEGDGELARKCREFAINKSWGDLEDESSSTAAQPSLPDLIGLTDETKQRVLEELGWPAEDEQTPQ